MGKLEVIFTSICVDIKVSCGNMGRSSSSAKLKTRETSGGKFMMEMTGKSQGNS